MNRIEFKESKEYKDAVEKKSKAILKGLNLRCRITR